MLQLLGFQINDAAQRPGIHSKRSVESVTKDQVADRLIKYSTNQVKQRRHRIVNYSALSALG
jgi:hypothetical protein